MVSIKNAFTENIIVIEIFIYFAIIRLNWIYLTIINLGVVYGAERHSNTCN